MVSSPVKVASPCPSRGRAPSSCDIVSRNVISLLLCCRPKKRCRALAVPCLSVKRCCFLRKGVPTCVGGRDSARAGHESLSFWRGLSWATSVACVSALLCLSARNWLAPNTLFYHPSTISFLDARGRVGGLGLGRGPRGLLSYRRWRAWAGVGTSPFDSPCSFVRANAACFTAFLFVFVT